MYSRRVSNEEGQRSVDLEMLKRALKELAETASELGGICERENMGFVQFWRSVSAEAFAVAATEDIDTAELERLVRDVVSTFSYHPGGFMELYVVREDPRAQAHENLIFERARERVRNAAGLVKHLLPRRQRQIKGSSDA